MFMNELKSKFNSFLQNGFKCKQIHNSFWRKFPTIAKQMPSKVLFVSKKTRLPFGHLRTKIVIVSINFVLNMSHCVSMN